MKHRQEQKSNTRLLIVWSVTVLVATLFPFDFSEEVAARRVLELSVHNFLNLPDIILNILMFVPMGLLLAQKVKSRPLSVGWLSLLVGAGSFAFSLSIESLQHFLPSRDSSLVDVLSNTCGALIGAHAYRRWGGRLEKFRQNASFLLSVGVLLSCSFAAVIVFGVLQYRTRLNNWDPEFPFLIGNEFTGDRPWTGRVLCVELSDASTSETLLHDFAEDSSHHPSNGNILDLKFAGNTLPQDAAAKLPPLVWVGGEGTVSTTGVKLDHAAWLQSAEPPGEIAIRVRAANEFTLRLVCASDNADQHGPARIVSYSIDTMRRNFTVGQEGPDMVFRLRTPDTGPNGTHIPLVVPGVFSSGGVQDILVTYTGAKLQAAVAGTREVHSVELSPAIILASYYLPPQPRFSFHIKLFFYGIMVFLIWAPFAWVVQGESRYIAVGLPWFLIFAFILEATSAFAARRPFHWPDFGLNLVLGATVLYVIKVTFYQRCTKKQCLCKRS